MKQKKVFRLKNQNREMKMSCILKDGIEKETRRTTTTTHINIYLTKRWTAKSADIISENKRVWIWPLNIYIKVSAIKHKHIKILHEEEK